MNITSAISKFQKAGATVTSSFDKRNNMTTYYAKFEGKKTIEFLASENETKVDTFAIIYDYDNCSQETLRFFRNTAKAAIECATR